MNPDHEPSAPVEAAQSDERSELDIIAEIHSILSNHRDHPGVPGSAPPDRLLPFPRHAWSDTTRISLPAETEPTTALTTALRDRRSHHRFAATPLALEQLGSLLRLSYGATNRAVDAYGYRRYPLNTAPSAGALQPVNIYVAARNVTGLRPSVYYFHPYFGDLWHVHDRDLEPLLDAAIIQPEFRAAPAVLVLTCSLDRTLWKYSLRHYRTVHVDTGIVAQNIYLVATALGLATCAIVGFYERESAEVVDISSPQEVVTLVVAAGNPADLPAHAK